MEARLRAFAAFARRRSFSAAALELRISQPAVSKHIADVERELGVRLVERQPRGGELTPAGAFLANHVLRAQALLAQAARGVVEFRQPATGSLSIVASGVPGTYLVPEVVATFQRAHPGVRVSIELATSARAVESLRSHRAEFGVVGGFAAAPEIEAEPLVASPLSPPSLSALPPFAVASPTAAASPPSASPLLASSALPPLDLASSPTPTPRPRPAPPSPPAPPLPPLPPSESPPPGSCRSTTSSESGSWSR